MKFLIVGLGSMGKRRIRNLQYLDAGDIIGFDIRADRNQEATERYGVLTFPTFDEAVAQDPDAMIICTPPDQHISYALIAAEYDKHFFVEASVVDDGLDELLVACEGKSIVAAPSCTMRFHPSVRTIKDLIADKAVGRVLCFTYHWGQYLPDWHPWEDYRSFYASKPKTGGCRETIPFELVWLTWVLGPLEAVSCFRGKVSQLDVDIDDVYQVLLHFSCGALGHLMADVLSRVPHHDVRFITEEGEISWNFLEGLVRMFSARDGQWREYPEPAPIRVPGYIAPENYYIEEMRHFLAALKGEEQYMYSFAEDKQILNLLDAVERSSDTGTHVYLGR